MHGCQIAINYGFYFWLGIEQLQLYSLTLLFYSFHEISNLFVIRWYPCDAEFYKNRTSGGTSICTRFDFASLRLDLVYINKITSCVVLPCL